MKDPVLFAEFEKKAGKVQEPQELAIMASN